MMSLIEKDVFIKFTVDHPENLSEICMKIKMMVKEIHPGAVELIWEKQKIASYGVGPKKMTEHYVYMGIFKKHVNLGFYYGTVLNDPKNLLKGTGKNMRHIKISKIEELDDPNIKELIVEAYKEREESKKGS